MDTLYTFWDNITHYETESVHFLGLVNSATKRGKKARLLLPEILKPYLETVTPKALYLISPKALKPNNYTLNFL